MYIVIINTHSGRHGNLRKYEEIKASLVFDDIPFYMDSQNESFWETIRETCHEMDHLIKGIVVIGGDGSLHHCINQLNNLQLPFGLIPSGSGNDFAKAMSIPSAPVKAMERILCNKQSCSLDLIKTKDHSILSILSAGLDAESALRVEDSNIKKTLNSFFIGKFIYIVTVFQIIRSFSPFTLTLTFKEGEERHFHNVWLIAVGNTAYYGGGVPMCPKAKPSDGQLDIVVVHDVSLIKLLFCLPSVFVKKHISLPFVSSLRSECVHVETNKKVNWQGDGEAVEASASMTISCKPKSVKFMV
ncbi:diacylglycerol/lipid kinase family protein [Salisediminibacterium selenitireducens]|uniref:Diacylglycerol kinase catalytic region n=1 Tax=Bacillus selenitireducens (strain ATCC 700615 / DSM 15326 / MLS10) TaxID=439292 RepID=D6XUU1_BACIE|nr:YegS/Rv2252/BmrU family lipid kinase [Salisediminibacterium selenitireducens]ADH99577.1 diacylglycerol kinase catalytic region [[Bacillus] selenitireducens MLS10]